MSARRPLIYLGIFAALSLFYYFYEYKGGEQRVEREKKELKALSFSPDSAAEFTIVSRDGLAEADTIRVVRDDKGWMLAEPLTASADSAAVARLLRSASDAERNRVVEDSAANLAPFGLDQAQLTFMVTPAPGAEPQTLELGNKNPGESYIYARILDNPYRVVLLNSWLLGDLNKTVFQLRDKRLLEISRENVDRLVVRRVGGKPLEIVRHGGGWIIESPLAIRAGADSVNAVLDKLLAAEARAFVDTLPAQGALAYGLADPVLTVELREAGSGAIHGLAFGARDSSGSYYAGRLGIENRIFMAGADLFDMLAADPGRLRDMSLLSISRDSISAVRYSCASESWRAVHDSANAWSFAEPSELRLDGTAMDNFLWDLSDLKAETFIEQPSGAVTAALAMPEFSVEISGPSGTSRLNFAAVTGDSLFYASGGGMPSVAALDSMQAAKLNKGLRQMEYRKLVDFETTSVDRVEIDRPGGRRLQLEGGEGKWQVTEPEKKDAEGWKVQNLFWNLVDMEFEKVLSSTGADSAVWGFDNPGVAVRLWQGDSLVAGVVLGKELDEDNGTGLVALRKYGDQRTFAVNASVLVEIPDSTGDFTGAN